MEHVSIWGTPFPAILNPKNSTGSARGAKDSQNGVFFEVPIWLKQIYRDMKFISRGLPGRCAVLLITIAEWRPERMSAAAVISLRTVDRHVMPNNILCLQSLICFTSGAYILVHIENG